jgi:hypothetical protein
LLTSTINIVQYIWVLLGTVAISAWCWYKQVDVDGITTP